MSADEPVKIVAPDPAWRELFERERALLQAAIGEWVTGGIHHVGSTAVPRLDAKPTIDILAGVESLQASRPCFESLVALEYLYAPYRPEEMHWFCKPSRARRTHHLHLVPAHSARFRDELAFRDHLRANAETAREYAVLKRELARRFARDRDAYTDAKDAFISAVLESARAGVSRSSRPSPAGSGG